MKKLMILKVFILCTLLTTSCKKDDDPGCVKEENFFEAEFDGEKIEPRWVSGGSISAYTLSVYRNKEEVDDWEITLTSNNIISLHFSLTNITGPGSYAIDGAASNNLPPRPFTFTTTYIYVTRYVDSTLDYYFSKEGSGKIEVTTYNSEDGILIGTFNCELYNSLDPNILLPINGKFNINLSTLDIDKRPCWL